MTLMGKEFAGGKTVRMLLCFAVILSLASACTFLNLKEDEPAIKKWTFLFYDDADFENAYDPLEDFSYDAYSGDNVNVLVLQDRNDGEAGIYYLEGPGNVTKVRDMGEVDMGAPETLSEFLRYARKRYPSERTFITFYDHGGGWAGACVDVTSDGSILSMEDMQKAFGENGGVDIVCYSAPCLMGALESVFELRNLTDVYIGSENLSGYLYWNGAMKTICDLMEYSPDMPTFEMGKEIVGAVHENARINVSKYYDDFTMSAVRTDRMEALGQAVDALAQAFCNEPAGSVPMVRQARAEAEIFSNNVDIYDLVEKFRNLTADTQLQNLCQQVMDRLEDSIIYEAHGDPLTGAHGLAVYCPESRDKYSSSYGSGGYGLDFATETSWDEFLDLYLAPSGSASKATGENLTEGDVSTLFPETDGWFPRRLKDKYNK